MSKKKLVIHPIQLLNVAATDVKAKVLRDDVPEKNQKLNVDVSSTSKVVSDQIAYAYLKLKIGFDSDEPVFDIKITFKGTVKALKPCTQSDLKEFAENQAVTLIWPFAREYLSSLTQRMGFAPLVLPTINVFNTISRNSKIREEKKKVGE